MGVAKWNLAGLTLLLSIAASWVGVSQFARAAQLTCASRQPGCAMAPLMAWTNCVAWTVLALPHIRVRQQQHPSRGLSFLLRTEAFEKRHPPQFLVIALTTNFAYMAAFHFLPASLVTAVFCANPVLTLLLSACWLEPSKEPWSSLCFMADPRVCSVVLSFLGVIFIAEPWKADDVAGSVWQRVSGVLLALGAALGTSIYQVRFKHTFGDSLTAEDVGLFLAAMGVSCCIFYGALLVLLLETHVYSLVSHAVPWSLVACTAVSSTLFNFLIKFGLSKDSPLSVSLATQIGIPLNLLLDVMLMHAPMGIFQVGGTALMLMSFTLQQRRAVPVRHEPLLASQ